MAIRFSCSCGQKITARNEYAGKRVQCNNCKKVQTVPGQRSGVPTKLSTSRPTVAPPPPPPVPPLPATLVSDAPPLAAPVAPPVPRSESPLLAQPVTGSTVLRATPPATMTGQDPRTAGVRFRCLCGGEYQARPEHAGQPARCPCCGEVLFIPARSAATAGPVLAARDRPDRYQPHQEGLSMRIRLGIVAGVVVLLAAAGYGAWAFYFKDKADDLKLKRAQSANALDFVPADAVGFVSVRVADYADLLFGDKLLGPLPPEARETFKKQRENVKNWLTGLEKKLGFRIADVERVVAVVPDADGKKTWAAVQLKTSARIDRGALKQAFEVHKEETIAGKSYFPPSGPGKTALHIAGDHLFVLANTTEGMKAFLSAKRGREGPLSPALERAASDKHPLVLAASLPPQAIKAVQDAAEKAPEQRRRYAPLLKVRTVTLFTANRGDGEIVHIEAIFPEPASAEQASKLLPELLAAAKRELGQLAKDFPPGTLAPVLDTLGRVRGWTEKSTLHVTMMSEVPGLGVGAIAAALLLPAVQKVREAAGRVQAQPPR